MNGKEDRIEDESYHSGHPWYYLLGGQVLSPRTIMQCVQSTGYRGYRADEMDRADKSAEPKRTQTLKAMRETTMRSYRSNLARYRELVFQLHIERKNAIGNKEPRCTELHTGLSLKHNHLYNDFAHLIELERLISEQGDLFDF